MISVREEVKKQLSYISLGFSALAIPFLEPWQIIFAIAIITILIIYIPPRTRFFTAIAREIDLKAGFLINATRYSLSFLILAILVLINFPLYLLSATIAIVAFGDGLATVAGLVGDLKQEKTLRGSLTFLILGSIAAYLSCSWYIHWRATQVSLESIFFLAVVGSAVGALIEAVSTQTNQGLTVPIGSAMAMWFFSTLNYSVSPIYLLLALSLTLSIGIASYKSNIADLSGVLSGTLLGMLIIIFTDLRWFLVLLAFLILGSGFTKYKYAYKLSIGVAQSKGGARGASNVFGNGLSALFFAIAYGVYKQELFLYAFLGAISTATGDTLASEIGGTSKKLPVLITNLKPVPHGTSGGITLLGELACALGAASIGMLAIALAMGSDLELLIFTLISGIAGANIDSLLGATLEKKYLSNSMTNLAATFFGGLTSATFFLLL
ncbi:MAG: DUF92 domain-containing protein [Methanocellales archaeon]